MIVIIIDMPQNSQSQLCRERDKMVNHMISECHQLAQKKYKTRHNSVGKVIQCE